MRFSKYFQMVIAASAFAANTAHAAPITAYFSGSFNRDHGTASTFVNDADAFSGWMRIDLGNAQFNYADYNEQRGYNQSGGVSYTSNGGHCPYNGGCNGAGGTVQPPVVTDYVLNAYGKTFTPLTTQSMDMWSQYYREQYPGGAGLPHDLVVVNTEQSRDRSWYAGDDSSSINYEQYYRRLALYVQGEQMYSLFSDVNNMTGDVDLTASNFNSQVMAFEDTYQAGSCDLVLGGCTPAIISGIGEYRGYMTSLRFVEDGTDLPEPGAPVLIAGGLLALAIVRRRKASKARA